MQERKIRERIAIAIAEEAGGKLEGSSKSRKIFCRVVSGLRSERATGTRKCVSGEAAN